MSTPAPGGDAAGRRAAWWGMGLVLAIAAAVETAAQVFHPHGQPWENGPILECREPRVTLQEIWPRLRSW